MSISLYRSLAGQYEHLRRVNSVSMMNVISHRLEEQVIQHQLPVDFYAGFQRFSRFPDQLRRYQKLGAVCRRVYVLGVADVKPKSIPGVEYIALEPSSPLALEWFLLVDTPDFWSLLSTLEVDGHDELTGNRRYDGVWTFDESVVDRASLLLTQFMGQIYKPVTQRNYAAQNRHIAEISGAMVSQLEHEKRTSHRSYARANTLMQSVNALTRAANSSPTEAIAQAIHTVFGASGVIIGLLRNQQLKIAAAVGETSATPDAAYTSSVPLQVLKQAQTVHLPDLRGSFDRDPLLPTAQALLAVPVLGRGDVQGVLVVGSQAANLWSESDVQMVAALGKLLALIQEPATALAQPAATAEADAGQLQAPVAYLMMLQRKLRSVNGDPTQQAEVLNQLDRLTLGLARAIGVPDSTVERIMKAQLK